MAKDRQKRIFVYAHWENFDKPVLMGILNSAVLKGKEIFSFEYDRRWLDSSNRQFLDPDLQFYGGAQYPDSKKNNFGLFTDSSPDRWGRMLMRRREAYLSKIEHRTERQLTESDYLLGVFDGNRMGGLRFKLDESGPFLDDKKEMAAPPFAVLKELEYASLQLEREDIYKDSGYYRWLKLLIAPGSSLGGARPKATVTDDKGHLWIAKFPSRNDDINKGAWEMILNQLAGECGIKVPECKIRKISGKNHTFLTKRFDRTDDGRRIHFSSAMTMLGYTDHQNEASYLEFAEFLMRYGCNVDNELEEIWRRIVFNICVQNTDDHLRNHGFILTRKGWILSPAFDMNPDSSGSGLSLNINENDNSLDLNLAFDAAEFFRIKPKKAKHIISEISKTVKKWYLLAGKYKISKYEQERMSNAFLQV